VGIVLLITNKTFGSRHVGFLHRMQNYYDIYSRSALLGVKSNPLNLKSFSFSLVATIETMFASKGFIMLLRLLYQTSESMLVIVTSVCYCHSGFKTPTSANKQLRLFPI
jgi:hypothetical protein